MTKILELSKKIAEAGWEPDMIYSEHSTDNLTQWLIYPTKDFCDDGMSEFIAYFTADWCWKVLPTFIYRKTKAAYYIPPYYLMVIELQLGYFQNSHGDIGDSLFEITIKDSLHEALLELVCWCIDNGYLKAGKE